MKSKGLDFLITGNVKDNEAEHSKQPDALMAVTRQLDERSYLLVQQFDTARGRWKRLEELYGSEASITLQQLAVRFNSSIMVMLL